MDTVINHPPLGRSAIRNILKNWAKNTDQYLRVAGIRGLMTAMLSAIWKADSSKNDKARCEIPDVFETSSSDVPTYDQVFLKREYDFDVKCSPKVIVDAGANIGLASVYFSNRFPNAKILAIEPEVSNFELLKKNIAQYDNIIPIHGALWNQNSEIDLMDPGLGKWGFMTQGADSGNKVWVNGVTA